MERPFNFREEPFEAYPELDEELETLDSELADLEEEEEMKGGQRRPVRPTGFRPRPGQSPRPPKRPSLRPRPLRPPVVVGRSIVREPAPCVCPAHGTEFVRWAQNCLNQILGLQLPLNGVMGPETRSAVRSFQRQQGLRASGIVGPDTEEALRGACGARPSSEEEEGIFAGLIGQQETDLEEEYQITSNCTININPFRTINLANRAEWDAVSKKDGGVYVIRTLENRVHYVGKEDKFVERFNSRYKVLRDLALDLEVLRGRTVRLYRVSSKECSTVEHRESHKTHPRPWNPTPFTDEVARSIAEWALARFYGRGLPGGLPPGNVGKIEPIHVLPPARLEVILDGNRIYPLGIFQYARAVR